MINKQIEAKRSSMLMVIIILCTITIIGTNYTFNRQSIIDINDSLMEIEYTKIGGKENYIILQEIQRREILGYLDKIREEQPELIKEILDKENNNSKYKILNENIIKDLKKDTSISGNTGALISIIEFSDLECPFCIESHKAGITKQILENNSDNINYIFKNFPLPSHKNSMKEAEASKCIENIAGGEKYLEYIDSIFKTTKGGGEGYKIDDLSILAEKVGVNNEEFNNCLEIGNSLKQVEREFEQGKMLGVNSVPSNLILNNETGKYIIVSEIISYEEMEKLIEEIKK